MGDVFHPIPGFTGGVSQQSPVMRLDTQCESSVNSHATVAEGLMKRPNTDFVKLLGYWLTTTGPFVHRIIRDKDEKYFVLITNSGTTNVRVFDLEGTEQTVRYGQLDADLNFTADSSVKSYLTSGITNSRNQYKAISVADTTIIVNTTKACSMKATETAARADVAYVWCKKAYTQGKWSMTFKWTESGVSQTYTLESPRWEESAELTTESILNWFITSLSHAKLDFNVAENILWATPASGSGIDAGSLVVTTSDPAGNDSFVPISKHRVDNLSSLPSRMPHDTKVAVGSNNDEHKDDYYLSYDSSTHTWTEDIGWEVPYQLDKTTMPHRLVRTAAGEFTFAPCLWADREVGDEDTNLTPSFVGATINNLRFHKNRLWLFSNENSVGSRAGEYFDFFKTTVLDVLADDPIDTAAAGEKVTHIRSAKGFDKGLLLIADEEQFVLTSGDQAFQPDTVAIDTATEFSAFPDCDSVKIGPDVYFPSPKGRFLGLRQYSIMPDTLVQDAYDVTGHVPRYIPKGTACMLDGCNQLDMLFLWTSAEPDVLFVHQFLWDGNSKVQQAWYKWEFADDIIGFKVYGTTLYILFDDDTNDVRLDKIELENVPWEDGVDDQPFRFHLDCLMKVDSGSYAGGNTTFTLPVNVGSGTGWTVVNGANQSPLSSGYTLSGTSLVITGDVHTGTYFVGRNYEMRHRLSEWYVRDDQQRAIISGTLQVRALTLAFVSSGAFEVQVTAQGRDTMTAEEMSGIRIGETVIGTATLLDGEKTFRIMASSKGTQVDIVSSNYLPVAIQMGAWIGTHTVKGTLV